MASKTTQSARVHAEGGVITDKFLRHQIGKGLAIAAPHTVPWLLGGGMLPVALATHAWWGTAEAAPWASAALALSGAAVTGVTWMVSRYRHLLGRLQSTGTAAIGSGWLLAATITGPTSRPTLDIGVWLGGTLAVCWNARNIVRLAVDPDETSMMPAAGPAALFRQLITGTAEAAGVQVNGISNIKVGAHRVSGTVEPAEGVTAADLQRALPAMEAAGHLPPGSLTVAENRADAGAPTVVASNPLLLENPIPHPGPSAVGASVARPLRVAMFQDGEPFGLQLVGGHLQIMGMTGAAKTTAGAWGIWGEWITRKDGALIVCDITKKEQTIAPARVALHGAVTDPEVARKLFKEWLPQWAEERLAEMGERGLIAWQERSGLSYLLVHLEEAADIFGQIDMEEFVNLARMLRSAGGGFVWSLQRADSTQMPTIVKGQGGSKVCFGVESSHDAKWGLTDAQDDAGARPEQWRAKYPAMAYADAGGVSPDRVAMAMRWFDWGPDDNARVKNFREHCERYPAAARPVDPATARLLAKINGAAPTSAPAEGQTDTEVSNVAREYLKPDPELDAEDAGREVDPDAELADVPEMPLGGPTKMEPEQARAYLGNALQAFADGRPFAPRDLAEVLAATGLGRGWLQKQLRIMAEAGRLDHDKDSGTYRMRVLQPA
jgi:hypothetical protein